MRACATVPHKLTACPRGGANGNRYKYRIHEWVPRVSGGAVAGVCPEEGSSSSTRASAPAGAPRRQRFWGIDSSAQMVEAHPPHLLGRDVLGSRRPPRHPHGTSGRPRRGRPRRHVRAETERHRAGRRLGARRLRRGVAPALANKAAGRSPPKKEQDQAAPAPALYAAWMSPQEQDRRRTGAHGRSHKNRTRPHRRPRTRATVATRQDQQAPRPPFTVRARLAQHLRATETDAPSPAAGPARTDVRGRRLTPHPHFFPV